MTPLQHGQAQQHEGSPFIEFAVTVAVLSVVGPFIPVAGPPAVVAVGVQGPQLPQVMPPPLLLPALLSLLWNTRGLQAMYCMSRVPLSLVVSRALPI